MSGAKKIQNTTVITKLKTKASYVDTTAHVYHFVYFTALIDENKLNVVNISPQNVS